jgi:hypothetical protein
VYKRQVLVGGWAPFFLIEEYGKGTFRHIGSIDIDLAINPDTIDEDAYSGIIERIESRGYKQRMNSIHQPIHYSYVKNIRTSTDDMEYKIQIDFLTSSDVERMKHRHRSIQGNLRARMCEESIIAFENNFTKRIEGMLPGGSEAASDILVVNIPACLGMKGIVLGDRYKEKDAYDIFTVITQCRGSPSEVAEEVGKHLDDPYIDRGIGIIKERFKNIRNSGPAWVADFLQPSDSMARERTIAEVYVKMKEFIENLP